MPDAGAGEKLKVFISYSRKDSAAFADELVAGLELAGFRPFLDRHDIAAGEEWEARLGGLIEQSDTVVFVVSPEAIKSDRCVWEVDRTLAVSKRLLGIIHIAVPDNLIPEKLSRLQLVRFDAQRGVTRPLQELAAALRQDLDWIREHTRLGEIAMRWDRRGRPESLLLRGIVTASRDKMAHVWIVSKEMAVVRGNDNDVISAAFSPDGTRIVTASKDGTARIWDVAGSKEAAVLRDHAVISAAFSADGSRIVTASKNKTAHIFETATGKEITVLGSHFGRVSSASFSPDGSRIVTVDGDAHIWDAASSKEIAVLEDATSAAFSRDGSRIVTASAASARVWDAANGKEIAVLKQQYQVYSPAFSPDGSRIVMALEDGTARIWDAARGKEIAVLRGEVNSATFSPDGSRIVTAAKDGTARIWDAASTKEIAVLRGHEKGVASAAFNRDGSRVITVSLDGTARIWDVHLETMPVTDLLAETCMRLLDSTKLTRDEMRLAGRSDNEREIDVCGQPWPRTFSAPHL
jgi:WD40 repeat protein